MTAAATNSDLIELVRSHLEDGASGFSVGGFGALAEFQDAEAALEACERDALIAACPRGALAVQPTGAERICAYEALSARSDGWQCGIGVLGERARCALGSRRVLTELGPDRDAVFAADRDAVLFDLGAGLPHVDFCVRSSDDALNALLRRHAGSAVIAEGHPVMEAVIDASPPRVVRSAIARIEVRQRIDRHRTPTGPHTHLLPGLLRSGRTHSANVPFPAGSVPLLTLHPENPLNDALGRSRPFARPCHERFQRLLERFGDRAYVAAKRALVEAVCGGVAPHAYRGAATRTGRLAERVALRQLGHAGLDPGQLARWQARLGH